MGRSKLSPTQLRKASVHRSVVAGAGARVVATHVYAETREDISSWAWEDTRDEPWAEDACESIGNHAESLGVGQHRYFVHLDSADGKTLSSTWCRVSVSKGDVAASSDDDANKLDGSAETFTRLLMEAFNDERRARHESLKMLSETLSKMATGMNAVLERTAKLEAAHTERIAATPAPTPEPETKGESGADIAFAAFSLIAPSLGEKLGDKIGDLLGPSVRELAPMLAKMASGLASGADAPAAAAEGVAAVVDVPTPSELPS